jgi:hypothetical protein
MTAAKRKPAVDEADVPEDMLPCIDMTAPINTASMHSLMVGHDAGLFEYMDFYELDPDSDTDQSRELFELIGRGAVLPTEPGTYYLVVCTVAEGEQVPHLIPEGDVQSFVRGAASRVSRELAGRVNHMLGLLPAPPARRGDK